MGFDHIFSIMLEFLQSKEVGYPQNSLATMSSMVNTYLNTHYCKVPY